MKRILILVAMILLSMLAVALPLNRGNAVDLSEEGPAYFVVFSGWDIPADADTIITDCGGRVVYKFPNVGVLVALPTIDPTAFGDNLNQKPEIIDFGHDYILEVPNDLVILADESELEGSGPQPVDTYYWLYQWHFWHTIEASPSGAWSITTGSHDIKVAVLDTGIDYRHPDLAPNYDFGLSMSFVDWNFDGIIDEPEMDEHGHGSWCGGCVAAAFGGGRCIGMVQT